MYDVRQVNFSINVCANNAFNSFPSKIKLNWKIEGSHIQTTPVCHHAKAKPCQWCCARKAAESASQSRSVGPPKGPES